LKEWVTYAQGKLYKKLVYNYDSKGNESEVYLYYNKDKFDEKIAQKYDSKNRLIEMEIFSNRKEYIEKKEYLYDQENHLVSIILKNDNIIVSKNIFRYDTNNNITEEQNYRDSTLIDTKTYIYSYDSHNNWTKKFLLQDLDLDKEVLIEERKIIYYE
jgi:putative YD repeat protein